MNDFESTEVTTVSDSITTVGDDNGKTMPLGVGNFEDIAHDPLAGAEAKRRLDIGSLLIFGVVVISIGGLVAMRALAGDEDVNTGDTDIDATISAWIDNQRTDQDKGPVVTLFPEEYLNSQVPLKNVQKNPFILFDPDPEDTQAVTEDPLDPEVLRQRARDEKTRAFETAATRIRIQSVLMSRTPLANVNDTIVRTGEVLTIEPEGVEFRVAEITGQGITMVAEDPALDLVYEVVLEVHKD